jgi:succinate dehydrogenase (ubiquinone) membrane anchor subunit
MLAMRMMQRTHGMAALAVKQQTTRQLPALTFATSPQRSSSDHVRLWTAEKVVSAAMVPAFIVPFMHTTPLTDAMFCTLAILHSHWGIEAIVVDYIRPVLFGGNTTIPNICVALVWALSAFTLGALYYFAYTDVGIVNAIKMLWKL